MAIAYKSDLSLNDKLLIGFVRAGEFSKRLLNTVLRNYGLTFPQYNVLRVLDASVKGHNTCSNVCKIMIVSGPNITGIAKRLEKNGFLIRKGDPKDGRIALLAITPKGKKTLNNIEPVKDANLEKLLADFSHEDKLEILEKVSQFRF